MAHYHPAARNLVATKNVVAPRFVLGRIQQIKDITALAHWLGDFVEVTSNELPTEIDATRWLERQDIHVVGRHRMATVALGRDDRVRAVITHMGDDRARVRIYHRTRRA